MTDEQEVIAHYKQQYERVKNIPQGWADIAEYWREKYVIVCKENNALRQKVSKQYRKNQKQGVELLAYTITGEVIVKMPMGEYVKLCSNPDDKNSLLNYGDRVRIARKEMKLSQLELSDMLGISRNYLSQIERGIATNISAKIVKDIEFQCGVLI